MVFPTSDQQGCGNWRLKKFVNKTLMKISKGFKNKRLSNRSPGSSLIWLCLGVRDVFSIDSFWVSSYRVLRLPPDLITFANNVPRINKTWSQFLWIVNLRLNKKVIESNLRFTDCHFLQWWSLELFSCRGE